MELEAIDGLSGLRAALVAPAEERLMRFRDGVMEPLRPFWEPFMGWMPPAAEPTADPALNAARTFGYYTPELPIEPGLAALDRLEQAGSWAACVDAVHRGWAALDPAGHGVALDHVRCTLVLGNPAILNEQAGAYTGFGGMPGIVMVMAWPTEENLPRLATAMAHELNHNIRFSVEPFRPDLVTLGQYIVAEGLAEAFGVELCGEATVSPVVEALDEAQWAAVRPRFAAALETTGFDAVRGYIFGDGAAAQFGYEPQGLPDFAGYTVGYRVVRAYLARSGRSAAAATYLPWAEIVAGSGLF